MTQQEIASQVSESEVVHVVLVGAGSAGSSILAQCISGGLSKFPYLKLTLVDVNQYFESAPAMITVLGNMYRHRRFMTEYRDAVAQDKRITLMTGYRLTSVDPSAHEITIESVSDEKSVQQVPYDMLLLATGSAYPSGLKPLHDGSETSVETRLDVFKRMHDEIQRTVTKGIVIVGGSAVGCEMAGQIVDMTPGTSEEKLVTLVHSGERLLPRLHPDASRYAKNSLERRGVRVLLGQRINDLEQHINTEKPFYSKSDGEEPYLLRSSIGTEISAHMVVDCRGPHMNGHFLRETALGAAINDHDQYRVNESLQVIGHDNIFALGDANDVPCMKYAKCAIAQARTMGKNLQLLLPHVLKHKKEKIQESQDSKERSGEHWIKSDIPTLNPNKNPVLRQGIHLGSNDMVVSTEDGVLSSGKFIARARGLLLYIGAGVKARFDPLGITNITRFK